MNKIEFASQLVDIKEIEYRNTLAITSIIELLIEKKIISREDIVNKAKKLDEFAHLKDNEIPVASNTD